MRSSGTLTRRSVVAGIGASLIGIGGVKSALAQGQDIDQLVTAAKDEGELVFYCSTPESAPKRAIEGFSQKYGLSASFVRISSVPLQTRFASEAEAGAISADLIILAGSAVSFGNEGLKKGWLQSVSDANLPVVKSGEYAAKYLRGDGIGAVVQVAPWMILYNTDLIKGGDIPADWPDLLKPGFKDQVVLADVKASDAYLDEWSALLSRYGDDFFVKLRSLNPGFLSDGVQAAQAVGAGQFALHFPIVPSQATGLISKGAPVAAATFPYTSGVETTVLLANPEKVKHPNAARLFANYLLSPEGNKLFSADPGSIGVYASGLPEEYQAPKGVWAVEDRQMFQKLIGLQT